MKVLLPSFTIFRNLEIRLKLSLSHTAGMWQSQDDSTSLLDANVIALYSPH